MKSMNKQKSNLLGPYEALGAEIGRLVESNRPPMAIASARPAR
jgi:hypothetical protein